jgi:hypothetical protein
MSRHCVLKFAVAQAHEDARAVEQSARLLQAVNRSSQGRYSGHGA